MDELETHDHDVPEVEESGDGSLKLFENRNLFLCKNCKNPMGVSRSKRGK
jgi:hypothetical protein